jgi:hypothetical protein
MRSLLLVLLLTSGLAACASTKTSEPERRLNQCLSECRGSGEPPRPGPFAPNAGEHDQRSECEKRCQSR